MKLAEALVLRADCQRKIAQLRQRLEWVVKIQQGDKPAEDPVQLLAELDQVLSEYTNWVRKIKKTNALSVFSEQLSLADALAERDELMQRRKILHDLLEKASVRQDRYSRSEVKFETTIDIAQLQAQVDQLSKSYREFDFRIQEMNWKTELIEN